MVIIRVYLYKFSCLQKGQATPFVVMFDVQTAWTANYIAH